MKLIKVIIRPEKTMELKDALSGLGYHGITAKHASGFGEQKKRLNKYIEGKFMSKG